MKHQEEQSIKLGPAPLYYQLSKMPRVLDFPMGLRMQH